MTLHRLPTAQGLLSRKGAAVPAKERGAESEPTPAGADPTEGAAREAASEPFQLALVSFGGTGPISDQAAEPPPAASLLPFALFRKSRAPGAASNGGESAAAEPAAARLADRPATADAPAETAVGAEPGEPSEPAEVAARPAAPDDPLVATGHVALPVAARATPWHLILGGAAACAGVLGIAWIAFRIEPPAPAVPVSAPETAAIAAPPAQTAPEAAPPEASAGPETPTAGSAEPAAAPIAAPAPAAAADGGIAPSVDVVRIDNTGATVIAGRAAPRSEFILLDNGAPIGTVRADAFGEWVWVSSSPLPDGDHEFGLVPKAVTGGASVPAQKAAPEPEAPTRDRQPAPGATGDEEAYHDLPAPPPRKPDASAVPDALTVPVPPRKPANRAETPPSAGQRSSAEPNADFVVQLASVKTQAGAQEEWQKLLRRFPDALGGMRLSLHEARLADLGTVIRVRTGPFVALDDARDFCARIRLARQECLVVRTGADE